MKRSALSLSLLLLTGGCMTTLERDAVSQNPDHRIVVAPETPYGGRLKAYAPECPSWAKHRPAVDDNMPLPQTGCATQRNLALMIAEPTDLVAPEPPSLADGQREAAAKQRYHEGKVSGLYDPNNPPAAKE